MDGHSVSLCKNFPVEDTQKRCVGFSVDYFRYYGFLSILSIDKKKKNAGFQLKVY